MRFSQSRDPDWPLADAATKLAVEAEAWANGELGQLRAGRRDQSVAPWLILNRVAHADLDTLWRTGRETPGRRLGRRGRRWAAAELSLVHSVLEVATTPCDLAVLQRRVLIPLEMQLVERSQATTVTLGDVLEEATTAVARSRL